MKNARIFVLCLTSVLCLTVFSCKNSSNNGSNQSNTVVNQGSNQPNLTTKKTILFFGNSLTAGYGLDEPSTEGYVALAQQRLDSLQLPYTCINAGLSGETTAGGASRVAWVISQQPIDVFVLELGGNDALRGIEPSESIKNLQTIIDIVKIKYPSAKIVLAGMKAPQNLGKSYIEKFGAMYPTLSTKNNIALIPFILEGVGGVSSLNQKDGIHPTAEGNKILLENMWKIVSKIL